jgi:trehalose 6-phosphate synthase/phosphatase
MKDHLVSCTANIDLQILQGNKTVEIRNSGINKGVAGLHWLQRAEHEFVLAVGDDWTDEDLFAALPEPAWSLRVGIQSSRARYNIWDAREVIRLLESLLAENAGGPRAALRGE